MPELLFRRTYDAADLLREHPPKFRHPLKAALFEIAYPGGVAPPGQIDVTRWPQHVPDALQLSPILPADVRPDFYDYQPVAGMTCVEWHVNFADPRLFAAYGSGLLAQDEMQIVEHPLLASVREALLAEGLPAKTTDESGATPILVRNVERRIRISTNPDAAAGRPMGLYGNRFMSAPWDVIQKATRRIEPATYSNIIAIAAPAGGRGEYTEGDVAHIFATAYTGFAAAVRESASGLAQAPACGAASSGETVVHTGFWGCGAFGGNRRLMVALQVLAARAANISRLILHAGDPAGAAEAQRGLEVAESLAIRCGTPCSLGSIAERSALLGCRWGVSDGN